VRWQKGWILQVEGFDGSVEGRAVEGSASTLRGVQADPSREPVGRSAEGFGAVEKGSFEASTAVLWMSDVMAFLACASMLPP
jgi:hypothetical protein